MYCLGIIYASFMHRLCIVYASFMHRLCIVYASYLHRLCIVYASFYIVYGFFVPFLLYISSQNLA